MAFVSSNRNKQKLTENGYVYVVNKKVLMGQNFLELQETKERWLQSHRPHLKWQPAVIKRINDHNHSGSVEIHNAKAELKEKPEQLKNLPVLLSRMQQSDNSC